MANNPGIARSTAYKYLSQGGWEAPKDPKDEPLEAARKQAIAQPRTTKSFQQLKNNFPSLGDSTLHRILQETKDQAPKPPTNEDEWRKGGRPPEEELIRKQGFQYPSPMGTMIIWTGTYNENNDPIYGAYAGKGKPRRPKAPLLNRLQVQEMRNQQAEARKRAEENWHKGGRPPLGELLRKQGIHDTETAVWTGGYNSDHDPIYTEARLIANPQNPKGILNRSQVKEMAAKAKIEAEDWKKGGRPPLEELLRLQGLHDLSHGKAIWTGRYNRDGDPIYTHWNGVGTQPKNHGRPLNRPQVLKKGLHQMETMPQRPSPQRPNPTPIPPYSIDIGTPSQR
jgi:hypothetical protein